MTFTTPTFLIFLVIVFAIHWTVKGSFAQNTVFTISSYFFYGWWDWRFCGLMLVSSLIDFFLGLGIGATADTKRRRLLLILSLGANLGMLGFFKYFGFFTESFSALADSLGWRTDPLALKVILPVGISFYTFQTLSYTIDIYRGHLFPTRRIIAYLAYVSSFPQLVAGPIERGAQYLPQFLEEREFDYSQAVDGCRQILWGFFKKMVIADNLAVVVDRIYGDVSAQNGPALAFATVCFAFQIYCDFSAYSDIAIGTARLFGLRLMRNFAYPYFSQSIGEFWRRWHISLSTWFRDYVYIPLGGSRVTRPRLIFNIFLTFVLSGLWHGASWNFLIWGGIMGLGIIPELFGFNQSKLSAADPPGQRVSRMVLTFTFVCLGWIFFRSETLADAITVLGRIASDTFRLGAWSTFAASFATNKFMIAAPLLVGLLVSIEWIQRRHPHPLVLGGLPRWIRWIVYTILIWITMAIGPKWNSSFIYFQF